MNNACTTTARVEKHADRAAPHRRNENGQVDRCSPYEFKTADPAGSIYSSARDLSRWLSFQLTDRRLVETHTPQVVLKLDERAKALHPDTHLLSYGMGWVIQDYRGLKLVSHGGAIDGYRAHITLVPEQKFGLAILCNLHETRMNLALSNSLIDLLLLRPQRDWNRYLLDQTRKDAVAAAEKLRLREANRDRDSKPTRELAAYLGRYEHPVYGTLEIKLQKGALVWRWNDFTVPLEHFHYDTFQGREIALGLLQATFRLDAGGDVTAVKMSDILDVEFRKSKRP